jgi:transmembrane sensor
MDQNQLTAADLVNNESFINYVKKANKQDTQYWEARIKSNAEDVAIINEAREIVLLLSYSQTNIDESFYSGLKTRIDNTITVQSPPVATVRRFSFIRMSAAAILAIAFTFGGIYYYYANKSTGLITIRVGYGQTKTLWLPDSSKVILNANSTLKFAKNWGNANREVWLSGEGLFKISHVYNKSNTPLKFIVNADHCQVKVLGTIFNVRTAPDSTAVTLLQGKVKLNAPQDSTLLSPGEYAVYRTGIHSLVKAEADTSIVTAWVKAKYIFKSASVKEICQKLTAYYGSRYVVNNEALSRKQISGSLDLSSEAVSVKTLRILLNTSIRSEGRTYYIGN